MAKTRAGFGQVTTRLVSLLPFEDQTHITIHDLAGISEGGDTSVDHQRGTIGEALHESKIVRDEQDGHLAFLELDEFLDATIRKNRVADGERLVHNQDFGIHVNRSGECEAHVHAGRIFFHRPVHEGADFGEAFDLREYAFHVATRDAEDLAIQKNILAAAEFGIESSA